jgi:Flp pilus assembly protein TadD
VLAVGGWPDKAFQPSNWEWIFEAEPLSSSGRHEEAIAIMLDGIDQVGETAPLLYHLARFEARAGRGAKATEHLHRALELRPDLREHAVSDEDIASLVTD